MAETRLKCFNCKALVVPGGKDCPECGAPLAGAPRVYATQDLQDRSAPASLRRCPFCAEEIQAAAIICRFCNRDVHPIASIAATPTHAVAKKSSWWPLVGIAAFLLILYVAGSAPKAPEEKAKSLDARATKTFSTIDIQNQSTEPWASVEVTIAPSETGPFYSTTLPSVDGNGTAHLPLRVFADSSGRLFDPLAYRVDVVLIEASTNGHRASTTLKFGQ